ncbi:MAG: PorT family protein [Bacteroidales bacterium]|nr:PorT family protein [Bacteroidales bacterium]
MKKTFFLLAVFVALIPAGRAQFLNYGFRAGTGMAVFVDDISRNSPIWAFNFGGFVNYGFTGGQSLMAENFMLQTGLNVVCRGSRFSDVLEKGLSLSIDEGSYKAWYVQLPILATIRYELLIRDPGHFILFQVGPAVSYGVVGSYSERKISPYMPQTTWNYADNGDAFSNEHKPLNRLDVGAIIGVGYERHDLSVMLHFDYGFLAVSKSKDILKSGDGDKAIVPGGNNLALVLSVGYQIPFR